MPFHWVTECSECGAAHAVDEPHARLSLAKATRQPSEAALDGVRRGQEPLPTHELQFTSTFTPARNRPLTDEEKRRG